jgi:hypothetical protein
MLLMQAEKRDIVTAHDGAGEIARRQRSHCAPGLCEAPDYVKVGRSAFMRRLRLQESA